MDRRSFLRNLGLITGAGTVSMTLGNIPIKAMSKSLFKHAALNGKVLVLLQMAGGNDGLNTVIPYEDDEYYRLRPDIGIRKNDALQLSNLTGLNPSMTEFRNLYDQGKLGVVQNVGYPNQNRSHFRSTDIWLSASDSNQVIDDGWIGRYLGNNVIDDEDFNKDHPMAIQLGSSQSTLLECTCQGGSLGLTFEDPNQFYQLIQGSAADDDPPPNTLAGDQLKYIKEISARSIKFAQIIKEKADTVQNKANYPNTRLANQLAIIAQLIAGGLETQVYLSSMGGFDTHSNQLNRHADLLGTLTEAVGAFQKDLELMGVADRVVLMTFSEFGRTIEQNGSGGTDHGSAAPLFLIGNNVNGGIYGDNPDLQDLDNSGDNKFKTDFRQVYASLLRDQLNMSTDKMPTVLFNEFETLPIINAQGLSGGGPLAFQLNQNYPNPFNPGTTIRYFLRLDQNISLKVYDSVGVEVETLYNGFKKAGWHQIYFNGARYASGTYYCYLLSGSNRQTIKMVLLK